MGRDLTFYLFPSTTYVYLPFSSILYFIYLDFLHLIVIVGFSTF